MKLESGVLLLKYINSISRDDLLICYHTFINTYRTYFVYKRIDNIKRAIKIIKKRIHDHNAGFGTSFTDEFRPWALYALIIGFDGVRTYMMSIENSWQYMCNIASRQGMTNPKDLVRSGLPLVEASNGVLKMLCFFKN